MASDPFRIEGPALVSFSGGRTSGYMLRRILDAHGGSLPADVIVAFCNTGRERTETLDFVNECAVRWSVPVRWIEYMPHEDEGSIRNVQARAVLASHRFRELTYETASRNAEPFDALIAARFEGSGLPGTMVRYCSEILKTRTKRNFAWSLGWTEWDDAVGIRADEQRRVGKIRAANAKEPWTVTLPLAESGVSVEDVMAFWTAQPFDLRLRPHEGNCDLCFLKASWKIEKLCKERPDLARWWIGWEEKTGRRFRLDRPKYADFLWAAQHQTEFCLGDTDYGACACGD